jgi:hypothetical protein
MLIIIIVATLANDTIIHIKLPDFYKDVGRPKTLDIDGEYSPYFKAYWMNTTSTIDLSLNFELAPGTYYVIFKEGNNSLMISYRGLSDANPPLFYMESSTWLIAYTNIINYPRITEFPVSSLNITVVGDNRQVSSFQFSAQFLMPLVGPVTLVLTVPSLYHLTGYYNQNYSAIWNDGIYNYYFIIYNITFLF